MRRAPTSAARRHKPSVQTTVRRIPSYQTRIGALQAPRALVLPARHATSSALQATQSLANTPASPTASFVSRTDGLVVAIRSLSGRTGTVSCIRSHCRAACMFCHTSAGGVCAPAGKVPFRCGVTGDLLFVTSVALLPPPPGSMLGGSYSATPSTIARFQLSPPPPPSADKICGRGP